MQDGERTSLQSRLSAVCIDTATGVLLPLEREKNKLLASHRRPPPPFLLLSSTRHHPCENRHRPLLSGMEFCGNRCLCLSIYLFICLAPSLCLSSYLSLFLALASVCLSASLHTSRRSRRESSGTERLTQTELCKRGRCDCTAQEEEEEFSKQLARTFQLSRCKKRPPTRAEQGQWREGRKNDCRPSARKRKRERKRKKEKRVPSKRGCERTERQRGLAAICACVCIFLRVVSAHRCRYSFLYRELG